MSLEKPVEVEDEPVSDDESDPVYLPMISRPESPQPGTSPQSSRSKLHQNDDDDVIEEEEDQDQQQTQNYELDESITVQPTEWHEALELIGVKRENGQMLHKVKWKDMLATQQVS